MEQTGFIEYLLLALSVAFALRMYHSNPPPTAHVDNGVQAPAAGRSPDAGLVTPPARAGLEGILQAICLARSYDSIDDFVAGAKRTYEAVVGAFAAGDIEPLGHLLSADVREAFQQAIDGRNARGETMALVFVGFRSATVVDASIELGSARIEMAFSADLVSVTRAADGVVVAGAPDTVAATAEVWSFRRDLRAKGPEWLLEATEALA